MRKELAKLLGDYIKWCEAESKRVEKDKKNPALSVSPTLEGFYQWLKEEEK